jgi:hypothetical protein
MENIKKTWENEHQQFIVPKAQHAIKQTGDLHVLVIKLWCQFLAMRHTAFTDRLLPKGLKPVLDSVMKLVNCSEHFLRKWAANTILCWLIPKVGQSHVVKSLYIGASRWNISFSYPFHKTRCMGSTLWFLYLSFSQELMTKICLFRAWTQQF